MIFLKTYKFKFLISNLTFSYLSQRDPSVYDAFSTSREHRETHFFWKKTDLLALQTWVFLHLELRISDSKFQIPNFIHLEFGNLEFEI
jgi:hypothetical protein